MLMGYHFGILLLIVLTFVNTLAQLDEPCKLDNEPIEDTYCNTACKTLGPVEYRCDNGLVCCTCNYLVVSEDDPTAIQSHINANCSMALAERSGVSISRVEPPSEKGIRIVKASSII